MVETRDLIESDSDCEFNLIGLDEIKENIFKKSGCEDYLLKVFFPKDTLKKILISGLESEEKLFLINFISERPNSFTCSELATMYEMEFEKVNYLFSKLMKRKVIKLLRVDKDAHKLEICLENLPEGIIYVQ